MMREAQRALAADSNVTDADMLGLHLPVASFGQLPLWTDSDASPLARFGPDASHFVRALLQRKSSPVSIT